MDVSALLAADLRTFAGDAAIVCLTGGLATLSFIMVLVVMQGLVPQRRAGRRPRDEEPAPELRPLLGPKPPPPADDAGPLDRALYRFVRHGRGEPRVLRHSGGVTRIRIYHCVECSPEVGGALGRKVGACMQQRAFLGAVLRDLTPPPRALVETRCTLRGQPWCEFEVKR